MNERCRRPQTRGEELANTLSHGAGALLALVGAAALITRAAMTGLAVALVSVAAYGVSLILLYTVSALYHGVGDPERKARLRVWDHCSIFLLILGTYIPLCLLVVGGKLGWVLVLTNAVLAGVGIGLNAVDLKRFARVSVGLYVLMGWLVLVGIGQGVAALESEGLFLLAAGGVVYTLGIAFYCSRKRYHHFIWHLFVLLGSGLHYACIALYCM